MLSNLLEIGELKKDIKEKEMLQRKQEMVERALRKMFYGSALTSASRDKRFSWV